MTEFREHDIRLSDHSIAVIEKALLCYAQVVQIQTGTTPRLATGDIAHVAALIQGHLHCECSSPNDPGPPRPIPIEDRRVV